MLIVSQKEPHAGSLAYKNISQPETVAERTKLAKRMKDEFELPMTVLVDSMKDTSRAYFTDLPSPAFIIDQKGIVRAKMSWSQPEDISRFLKKMKEEQRSRRLRDRSTSSIPTSISVDNDLTQFTDSTSTQEKIIEYRPPTNWVTVSIHNQPRKPLCLQRVERDEVKTVLDLGSAKRISLKVASGYYVLSEARESSSKYAEQPNSATNVRIPIPADARLTDRLSISVSEFAIPKNLSDQWSYIPAGPAVVGDVAGLGRDEERPARIENVKAFLMGRFEVTNKQYASFLNAQSTLRDDWIDLKSRKCLIERTNCLSKAKGGDYEVSIGDGEKEPLSVFDTSSPNKPVVMVSREGALQYCKWLTEKTGVVHRLASEVEWEKAARGPESFLYAYGNVCRIKAANQESGRLRETGQFAPNGFGLYDMTGNCFEWVSGKYETSTKLTGLLRGGSFIFDGIYNRTSFRMRQAPTVMTDDIGFRVVREIEPVRTK